MEKKQTNIIFSKRIIIINILLNIILCESECERDNPIKIGTECQSIYCEESKYVSGECIKSNSIIKTQWLNNIILIGEENFRYINFITSDGKTLLYVSPYPVSRKRVFFGINSIGEPIFKDSNDKNIYILQKEVAEDQKTKYESTGGVLKINGDINEYKQYFISIGKTKTNTEIFDFDNYENELKIIKYDKIVKYNIEVCLGNLIELVEDDKQYYIIGLILTRDNQAFFYLIKFNLYFDSNNNILCESTDSETKASVDNPITFCHLSKRNSNIIICMNVSKEKTFKVTFWDINLVFKREKILTTKYDYTSYKIFFKFFPFKDDTFIFTYYKYENNEWHPAIQILEDSTTSTSFSINLNGSPIVLNKFDFNNTIMLTDIILIKEDLLCLSSTKNGKEVLIIVLINFYYEMDYNIRYYLVNFYELYKHKFLNEMKLHLYNNHIMLGFSFCRNELCDNDNNQHHTSLIIFSYPNTTDDSIDLIEHLKKEGNNNITLNLFDYGNIDNNIFGYILYGIKIYSIDDCGINFISNKTNETIKADDIISKNETIQLFFTENEYEINTCSLKYRLIVTEPDYEEYNKYPYYILKESDEDEQSSFTKTLYEGKVGKYDIEINEQLITNCGEENINCNLCLETNKSYCFICKYDYIYINNTKICNKTETPNVDSTEITNYESTEIINYESTEIPNNDETEIPSTIIILGNCEIGEIAKGNCPDNALTNEELKKMYYYIKGEIITEEYNYENIIIPTSDVYFQISSLEEQKNSNYNYLSSVDLKECETILKVVNNIEDDEPLIILKMDFKSKEDSLTYVKYEIYHPYTLELLNLSCCDKSNIIINVPAKLDSETISLYDNLNQFGYNLFNPNDSFYNDICTTYKSDNGTDISLSDRQKSFYKKKGNKSLCQNGCVFEQYISEKKKVVCQCSPQMEEKEPDLNLIQTSSKIDEIIDNVFINSDNSNFLVLKCYQLVFDFSNISKNVGMIIMTIILIIIIVLIIFYYVKEQQKIGNFIELILKNKFIKQNLGKHNDKNKSIDKNIINDKNKLKQTKTLQLKLSNNKNININTNTNTKKQKTKNKFKKAISIYNIINKIVQKKEPPKRGESRTNFIKSSDTNKLFLKKKTKKEYTKKQTIISNRIEIKSKTIKNNDFSQKFVKKEWVKECESLSHSKISIVNPLTERELNELDYKTALEKDKRTYIQFYWSLLKKKQIILFTFLPALDYNLFSIKLSLFLITFSLYFTVNAFFFDDDTMHKIYENKGENTFLFQIVHIMYALLICSSINTTLKLLSLSEKNILEIKKRKTLKDAFVKSKDIQQLFKIKYIFFFVFSFLLLFFCWYFISCFCIVYNNTQIILIEDTLISFAISLTYPFGTTLIPGFFRIYSLRAKNRDKTCLYKISQILAYFF